MVVAAALASANCMDGRDAPALSVYAASSLTEAFTELEALFERAHPDADVEVTFAGSQILRVQIEAGAPADVFASADPRHMSSLVEKGLVSRSRVFAGNELVVIVPLENPAGIERFEDLPRARRFVLGTAGVPAGRYARDVLAAADSVIQMGFGSAVLDRLVSEEPNVRLTRSKVELGEADAAMVYRTDAVASDLVRVIRVPPPVAVKAEYLIGVIERDDGSILADAWVELVSSPDGQAVLRRYGFDVD